MSDALDGQHALVTGGGTGIGAAIADALASAGASVTLVARNRDRIALKASQLPKAQALAADISKAEDVRGAFAEAKARFGPVSILVNNAGVAPAASFLEIDLKVWEDAIAVNMTGSFLCAQAALPDMIAQGWGRIITIASTAGLIAYKGVAAYVAAKHGAIGLTRALALEFARTGVTVNALCPGYTETDIARAALVNIAARRGISEAAARDVLAAKNPQGRLVQPEEVAAMALWLCRPESAAITGQTIALCGGEVMT